MDPAEPLPQRANLTLDLDRCLLVPLSTAREPLEVHRLAPRHRDGAEVPESPFVRAVDGSAHDRGLLVDGDHGSARLHHAGYPGALTRAFHEHSERIPVAHDLAHHPDRLAVGLAATYRQGAERAHELPQPRNP